MKQGGQVVIAAAARLYAPLIVLFALSMFVWRPPGAGVGVLAGLAFALMLALHALSFGVAAARAAFPPPIARALLALGALTALVGAGLPAWADAPRAIEAGGFAATCAGASLIVTSLFGRAPALRDAEW